MKIEFTRLALCLALIATSPGAGAEELDAETEIVVLSYNIHGLFPLIAKDDPRDRMPTIGWLVNRYEVVMFQEDFEYHNVLREQMPDLVGFRGNGMGWDPRRVFAKLLISPVSVFLPHFSPPYGAGISIFVRESLAIAHDFDREPYGLCRGWFGGTGDCWAAKGYQRVGIRTPSGAEIDLYNTHLEAGPSEHAAEIRGQQLDILARAIEARPKTRAVIIGGDLNIGFNRVGDRETLMAFRRRLELQDSGAGPELPYWRERDYILHRAGTATALRVEQVGEAQEFVDGDRALSDHAAIYARFRVTVQTGAERSDP